MLQRRLVSPSRHTLSLFVLLSMVCSVCAYAQSACTITQKNGTGQIGWIYAMMPTATLANWIDYTVTCNFTGGVQTFTVPAGADHGGLTVQAFGAAGGEGAYGPEPGNVYLHTPGGKGASVNTTLNVTPGMQLQIRVGGKGGDGASFSQDGVGGYNGGGEGGIFLGRVVASGGGGASDVRVAPYSDGNRVVVAGGGGGAGPTSPPNAKGGDGGLHGSDGARGSFPPSYADVDKAHTGGFGGTQTAAGAGGDKDPYYGLSVPGPAGIGSQGGTTDAHRNSGGGGGGGWFGGGGGEPETASAGGGGSSHGDGAPQYATGLRDGNGLVTMQYRVYTKRVTCVDGSAESLAESLARGSTEIPCQ